MNSLVEVDNTRTVRVGTSGIREDISREETDLTSFMLKSVELDGDELVVEIAEPVGLCPSCEAVQVGSVNGPEPDIYPFQFDCKNDECDVDIHTNRIDTEEDP